MEQKIVFATPETVRQPKNTVPIPQDQQEQDHILGASGPDFEIVCPEMKWLRLLWPEAEIQVVKDGDLYWCVIFSHNSAIRFVFRCRYQGEDLNVSERDLAIASHTIRGQGNGKRNVAETFRVRGFQTQDECPTPDTLDAAYAPLTPADDARAKARLAQYEIKYKFLPNNSVQSIQEGLKYSPVQVDVQSYSFNAQGYIVNNNGYYIHEVIIVEDLGDCWAVWDSENKQFLRYSKNYNFGSPMIHSIKKKVMTQFCKVERGVYLKGLVDSLWHPITSGDFFKNSFGEFKNFKIPARTQEEVEKEGIGAAYGEDNKGWSDADLFACGIQVDLSEA